MGYLQHYLQTRKQTNWPAGTGRAYDLPGLSGGTPAAPGNVDNLKREYNRSLNQYRHIQEELQQKKRHAFYTAADRKKQLLEWRAYMQKMLMKIGSVSEQEVQEGFDVDQSQRTP